MKQVLTRTIAAFALSSLLFASVASAVVTETPEDPYTDDASVSVTLEGTLNAEGKVDLSWDEYQGGDLQWYKVVHSTDNADAKYPMDGYVAVYTDPAETTYTHAAVSQGTNYYRVCVITTASLRGCSNTITIESDVTTTPVEEPVADPYTDDETIVVTLNGELTTEGKAALTWSKYEEGDLKWYKVVHSQTNDAAYYPVDGYVHVSSDFMANTYTHTSVLEGTNYYRVCVITTADMRGCSNTVTLEKGVMPSSFDDVADDHWAKDYIEDLADKGIVEGRDGNYEPESPILRAEAIKLVMYGAGLDGASCDSALFPDLNQEDWFCEVATKAFQKGIIKGDNGYLYPGKNITRAEAVKILLEAKGMEPPILTENPFDDVYFGDWYAGYIYKAFKLGYVMGVGDGLFEPNRSITRAEMAKIVSLAIQ